MVLKVHSLVEGCIPHWPYLYTRQRQEVRASVHEFVAKELSLAPLHIRLMISILGAGFVMLMCLYGRRIRLNRLNNEKLRELINAVARLNTYFASLDRLYRSLVVLAYYEHPSVLKIIEAQKSPALDGTDTVRADSG